MRSENRNFGRQTFFLTSSKGDISAVGQKGGLIEHMFSSNVSTAPVIYGQCINRFCKPQLLHIAPVFNSSGSLVTSLFAGRGITATECAEHREGILCGQCKSGFSLTMYYAVSELNFRLVFGG